MPGKTRIRIKLLQFLQKLTKSKLQNKTKSTPPPFLMTDTPPTIVIPDHCHLGHCHTRHLSTSPRKLAPGRPVLGDPVGYSARLSGPSPGMITVKSRGLSRRMKGAPDKIKVLPFGGFATWCAVSPVHFAWPGSTHSWARLQPRPGRGATPEPPSSQPKSSRPWGHPATPKRHMRIYTQKGGQRCCQFVAWFAPPAASHSPQIDRLGQRQSDMGAMLDKFRRATVRRLHHMEGLQYREGDEILEHHPFQVWGCGAMHMWWWPRVSSLRDVGSSCFIKRFRNSPEVS